MVGGCVGGLTVDGNSRWNYGEHILLRGVWRERLCLGCPVTIVRDTPDLVALYWQSGTGVKVPRERFTPRDMLSLEQPELVDSVWTKTDVLMLVVPGAAHSIYAMWDEGHTRFRCWYINLQDPLRRKPTGFDTMDHLLDIVVSPDQSEWWWKDEDEFAEAESLGVYLAEEAYAIRQEGARAVQLVQDAETPYSDEWRLWVPPAEWVIPGFPVGWDRMAD